MTTSTKERPAVPGEMTSAEATDAEVDAVVTAREVADLLRSIRNLDAETPAVAREAVMARKRALLARIGQEEGR